MSEQSPPPLTFCPFCGSRDIKIVKDVPRCKACRAVFFVSFSRYGRRPAGLTKAKLVIR